MLAKKPLRFSYIKKICDKIEGVDITNVNNFIACLKTEFERCLTDFKIVLKVMELLNSSFALQLGGE